MGEDGGAISSDSRMVVGFGISQVKEFGGIGVGERGLGVMDVGGWPRGGVVDVMISVFGCCDGL